jgi:hypothetical protein
MTVLMDLFQLQTQAPGSTTAKTSRTSRVKDLSGRQRYGRSSPTVCFSSPSRDVGSGRLVSTSLGHTRTSRDRSYGLPPIGLHDILEPKMMIMHRKAYIIRHPLPMARWTAYRLSLA